MKNFKIYKTDYSKVLPKITKIYKGYKGFKCGYALAWNHKFIPIILPSNEK
jgi:hypothetical protein